MKKGNGFGHCPFFVFLERTEEMGAGKTMKMMDGFV